MLGNDCRHCSHYACIILLLIAFARFAARLHDTGWMGLAALVLLPLSAVLLLTAPKPQYFTAVCMAVACGYMLGRSRTDKRPKAVLLLLTVLGLGIFGVTHLEALSGLVVLAAALTIRP